MVAIAESIEQNKVHYNNKISMCQLIFKKCTPFVQYHYLKFNNKPSRGPARWASKLCHGTIWPKGHNLASSFGDG
jgi:hypothetical protein